MKSCITFYGILFCLLLVGLLGQARAVEQGELELRLNGKTIMISGVMATVENKAGKAMLYLGATDPAARAKINLSLVLPAPLTSRTSFSSLQHDLLFTLKLPDSAMLIMPTTQPVKTSFEMIETNSEDPEGYAAALSVRRTKPSYELTKEELAQEERKISQVRPRTFRKKQAEWVKMDREARIQSGEGVMQNPGQQDHAIFVTLEPVKEGDTIVELRGTISGFAKGKQNKPWLLEPSDFRAIFITQPGGR